MGSRIAVVAIGTLGDILPFVALGVGLQRRGHTVLVCTTADFADLVTGHGLEFGHIGADIKSFADNEQFHKAMSRNLLVYAPSLLLDGQKLLQSAAKLTWPLLKGAEAIIMHINTRYAIDMAQAMGIPAFMTAFQPMYPTAEYPYCAYNGPVPNKALNRATYLLLDAQRAFYNLPRFRVRHDLTTQGMSALAARRRALGPTNLDAYSPTLAPNPGDWPTTRPTGPWLLQGDDSWTPSEAFARFLAEGDQPVYLGFGSMPWGVERNTEIIGEALSLWGGRAVIGQGWGGVRPEDFRGRVFAIAEAPHTRLFPLMRAVVHHGGAGTTYAGLRAGRPTLVVPQFFDQPYWGRRVHALGCGPRPVPLRKLTAEILAEALRDLTTNAAYTRAAGDVQAKLAQEDGTARAIEIIEGAMATHKTRAQATRMTRTAMGGTR